MPRREIALTLDTVTNQHLDYPMPNNTSILHYPHPHAIYLTIVSNRPMSP